MTLETPAEVSTPIVIDEPGPTSATAAGAETATPAEPAVASDSGELSDIDIPEAAAGVDVAEQRVAAEPGDFSHIDVPEATTPGESERLSYTSGPAGDEAAKSPSDDEEPAQRFDSRVVGVYSSAEPTAGPQMPHVEIGNLDPDALADELPGSADDEGPAAPFAGTLPGADDAARISAEMAAAQGLGISPAGDDLIAIKGVGPLYAQRLHAAGITTFEALAHASDELLEEITDGNLERVVREDWRGQARRMSGEA
jgi:predicted flap endonuclease-1-like 5' DNA nuclease